MTNMGPPAAGNPTKIPIHFLSWTSARQRLIYLKNSGMLILNKYASNCLAYFSGNWIGLGYKGVGVEVGEIPRQH